MTTRETVEAIRESPEWCSLTLGEKLDAILYAADSAEEIRTNRHTHIDVSDIVGEIFADYTN